MKGDTHRLQQTIAEGAEIYDIHQPSILERTKRAQKEERKNKKVEKKNQRNSAVVDFDYNFDHLNIYSLRISFIL